jgi:hypothetical protein
MSGSIDSSGDIEIFCYPATGGSSRGSVSSFDEISPGDRVALLFGPGDGAQPPYSLRVYSPTGALIRDSVLRDLPTGNAQSAAPVELVVSVRGDYRIEIAETNGRGRGKGMLHVR